MMLTVVSDSVDPKQAPAALRWSVARRRVAVHWVVVGAVPAFFILEAVFVISPYMR